MEKAFCPECQRETPSRIVTKEESYPVKGEPTSIVARVRVCAECGSEIYDHVLDDENLQQAYGLYRDRHGYLGPDKVREIRKRYGLSQRGLAGVLGWSPATINRYESNGVWTRAHNEVLKLLDDAVKGPDMMKAWTKVRYSDERAGVIENELGSLIESLSTHRPSLPDDYSGYLDLDFDRLTSMVLFFCQGKGVFKTKLMKLLWYSDFLHFREQTVGISGATYVHLSNGPALDSWSLILGILERKGLISVDEEVVRKGDSQPAIGDRVRALDEPNLAILGRSEREVLQRVAKKLGPLSATRLSDRSHKELAWSETKPGQPISYKYAVELKI